MTDTVLCEQNTSVRSGKKQNDLEADETVVEVSIFAKVAAVISAFILAAAAQLAVHLNKA